MTVYQKTVTRSENCRTDITSHDSFRSPKPLMGGPRRRRERPRGHQPHTREFTKGGLVNRTIFEYLSLSRLGRLALIIGVFLVLGVL